MIRRAHPEGRRHPRLPGAVRQPRDADALWLGHRRRPGHGRRSSARTTCSRSSTRARTTPPTPSRSANSSRDRRRRHDDGDRGSDDHPDPPPHSRGAADGGPDHRLPGADPRAAALPRAARDRDPQAPCPGRIRPDACQALRGHRPPRPHRHDLCLSGRRSPGRYVMDPSPIPKFDNPKMDDCAALQLFGAGREKRIYAVPPHTRVAQPGFRGPSLRRAGIRRALRALRRRMASISTRSSSTIAAGGCSSAPTPTIAKSDVRKATRPSLRRRPRRAHRRAGRWLSARYRFAPRPRATFPPCSGSTPSPRSTATTILPIGEARASSSRRFATYPDYVLYRRRGRGTDRRQLRAARDGQSRPSRSALGDRRGCRRRT